MASIEQRERAISRQMSTEYGGDRHVSKRIEWIESVIDPERDKGKVAASLCRINAPTSSSTPDAIRPQSSAKTTVQFPLTVVRANYSCAVLFNGPQPVMLVARRTWEMQNEG